MRGLRATLQFMIAITACSITVCMIASCQATSQRSTGSRLQAPVEHYQRPVKPAKGTSKPAPLYAVHNTVAAALSSDGEYIAVCTEGNSADLINVLRIGSEQKDARVVAHFEVQDLLHMKWHPVKKLITVSSSMEAYQLLDVNIGKKSEIGGGNTGVMTWLDNSDEIAGYTRGAGEKPGEMRVFNVFTRRSRRLDTSWFKEDAGFEIDCSKEGDLAISYGNYDGSRGIALYPRKAGGRGWAEAGKIKNKIDPASKKVIVPMFLTGWLWDGRLVYTLRTSGTASDPNSCYEMWTCNKYGADRRKWLTTRGVWPIQVSGDGRRILLYRDGGTYVYRADDLIRAKGSLPL